MSERSSTSSSGTRLTPRRDAASPVSTGSNPITCMPNARARDATSRPTLPTPSTPSVLPYSSTPMNTEPRSQRPARTERSAAGIRRASARIIDMVCSAAEMVFSPGAFITTTPRRVAAGTSMLSTPAPARPITRSTGAAAIRSSVTRVSDRTTSPTASWMAARSASGARPGRSTGSRPAARSTSAQVFERRSEIRIFIAPSRRARRRSRPEGHARRRRCGRPCGRSGRWSP